MEIENAELGVKLVICEDGCQEVTSTRPRTESFLTNNKIWRWVEAELDKSAAAENLAK